MKRYLFRLGIPTLLAIMFTGVLFILNSFEMRTRTGASLMLCDDGKIKVYVGHTGNNPLHPGDTVTLGQIMSGSLTAVIDSVRQEPAADVLYVRLPDIRNRRQLHERLGGNTFATGYVYGERVKLRTLLFKRIGQ